MPSKTKYIGTATTLTLTAILVWIALSQNFKLEASGDIHCNGSAFYGAKFKANISDCQVFFNVTSINYTYYFRNKNGIALNFSPDVEGYNLYMKDGRYSSGWRLMPKSFNFTFRKGVKYQFMVFVFKQPEQKIKWGITAAEQEIDPILFPIEDSFCQDNRPCTLKAISKICADNSTGKEISCVYETKYIIYNCTGKEGCKVVK